MSESKLNSACPDATTLRALLDGTLPEDQQATTQAHVDRCPKCETALRQMTAGGESWIGMAEKLKSGSEDDPKLAAALERLKTNDGSVSEPADPQRTLDFLQPSDDPKSLGRLGQHEISEVVGWGGMGVVLKAYDPGLHRVVTVKVLASHLAHHAVARKRFIREAQAAAAVCHDNVVTIHAIDEAGSQLNSFAGERGGVSPPVETLTNGGANTPRSPLNQSLPKIVMQFVAGGSLQERIDQDGPLELKEILRIAMQTAAGLAAAHAQGVVHRDVKPANILLENGVQRVKLTDFGLARVMDDASLTLSGVIAGTPQYMAPEQAWGRDVDARADLFSLGAVMYAMCSGHSPFRARTTMAVLKRVCEDAPRPLRAINPDVPEWLVAIIEKLLAKKPEDRFQTATEVSELLSRWLAYVQQPSVVPAPELVVPHSGGTVPTKGGTTNFNARHGSTDSAAALLAVEELKRRPDELRHRMRLWESGLWAFAALGVPVIGVLAVLSPMNYVEAVELVSFGLLNVLATLILITVFRAAWKTTRWGIWIGSMFFLPAAGMGFLLLASDEPVSGAMKLICSVQAVIALVFTIALMFSRPQLAREAVGMPRERWNGWQRLFAILFFTFFGMPLVFVATYGLLHAPRPLERQTRATDQRPPPVITSDIGKSQPDPSPAREKAHSEALQPLLGRWVVISTEGAALGSPAPIEDAAGSPFGSAVPSGTFGGGSMGGGVWANVASPTLQWIEFKADEVVAFDGHEAKTFVEFSEDTEPKQLALRDQANPSSDEAPDWRYGIYRLDRDRLIICWTSNGQPVPTEFAGDLQQNAQLLVLRREWNPPADFDPRKTPPPRAVIPFTADEAKRLQVAWAAAANVPVETANSLGMKLRLLPPGSFDSPPVDSLDGIPLRLSGASFSQPIYMATQEVTVAEFRKFVEATQYETTAERSPPESGTEHRTWEHPGIVQDSDLHPVVRVSWQDAQAFCRWLSDTEQQQYRLPTMTEWAFAVRAGLASSTPLKRPHNARLRFFDTTAPVGGDKANLFGLHDLFGNVSEWINDDAGSSLYPHPNAPPGGSSRSSYWLRLALGGGYQTSRKPGERNDWTLPQYFGEIGHLDDIGFRVARVINRDAETSSISLPPIEDLFATAEQVTILVNPDRVKAARENAGNAQPDGASKRFGSKKPTDPNAKPEFGEWKQIAGPVVALRGLIPVGRFPISANFVDFEIERAVGQNREGFFGPEPPGTMDTRKELRWTKVELQKAFDLLDQADFVTDTVPPLLTDSAFTMPLMFRSDSPWGELATHPLLPKAEPRSKYAVEFRLFRYFDFDVAKGQHWAYRVRLKSSSPKDSTATKGLDTPWAMTPDWVTVP